MQALGINISCSTETTTWNGIKISFQLVNSFSDTTFNLAHAVEDNVWDKMEATQAVHKSTKILSSKHEQVSLEEVAAQQRYLIKEQQMELGKLFSKFRKAQKQQDSFGS